MFILPVVEPRTQRIRSFSLQNFAEDFADFVFDGVGAGGALLEGVQVGEELGVDEVAEVVSRHGPVVIDLACSVLGAAQESSGRARPGGRRRACRGGRLRRPCRVRGRRGTSGMEPGGLFGLVERGGAAGLLRRTSSMLQKACWNIKNAVSRPALEFPRLGQRDSIAQGFR